MQVTVLGSGTALPTHRRASGGVLVEWRAGALLLDPSAGTYMRALKAGLDARRLLGVCLTHFHVDHTGDLPGILWARRQMEDLRAPLRIAGPAGTDTLLARLRAAWGDLLDTPLEVVGFPATFGELAVTAFPAEHAPESVCLRIAGDGRTLAFSGDTADCAGLREACAGADLALLECTAAVREDGHMTPEDCAAVAAAACPGQVLLLHLGPDVSGPLPMAEDGLVLPV